MKENEYVLNPNPLVKFLKKPASEFTREDIISFVEAHHIEMINFRYMAEDGRLKALTFVITCREHLESLLTTGERVDGSSLFSFIGAGSSDLYVIPRYKTAFVNPFNEIPTLDILCTFYTNEGKPLESAPDYVLKKAQQVFRSRTGCTFKAMGELEYYIIVPLDEKNLYPARDQKGYHETGPFTKFDAFRTHAMKLIAQTGGKIKYGHAEVGNFKTDKFYCEQQEIEFTHVNVEDAADQLVIAKWIVRNLANKYGLLVSFAPKITVGKAGSGLHIHFMVEKDGRNMMVEEGKLSPMARKVIAGILQLAGPLTAFGNTIPTSYLRLVPHQEAPTNICWGDRNRSVLIRVPLGWLGSMDMIKEVNPQDTSPVPDIQNKQTCELRSGDGSADVYNYLAGMVVAALHGLEMPDALKIAEETYMNINIFDEKYKDKLAGLKKLPASCSESADLLNTYRSHFEKDNVFPAGLIDRFIKMLKAYEDENLSEKLYGNNEEIGRLVRRYLHCS